jgi:hypothetical protein
VPGTYGKDIKQSVQRLERQTRKDPLMTSEFDFQFNARHRQDELLAEAATRRLTRSTEIRHDTPETTGRRLQTLLRRLAGSPTFA